MTDMLTYPEVTHWAVPFFIAAILAELLWIVIKGRGGRIYMSGVKTPLNDALVAGHIADVIGPEHFYPELRPAVDAATRWVGVTASREDSAASREEPASPAVRTRTAS